MENFIAAIVVLPFLLFFPIQYGVEAVNHAHITHFEAIAESTKEEAKQEGYFTPQIIDKLKQSVMDSYKNLSPSDIEITATTVPRYRTDQFDQRELITYDISIPIDKIIAGNELFGISDADNRGRYHIKGSIASELLMPPGDKS